MLQISFSACIYYFAGGIYFTLIKYIYSFYCGLLWGCLASYNPSLVIILFEKKKEDIWGRKQAFSQFFILFTHLDEGCWMWWQLKRLRISQELLICISIPLHLSILTLSFISLCLSVCRRLSSELLCSGSGTTSRTKLRLVPVLCVCWQVLMTSVRYNFQFSHLF